MRRGAVSTASELFDAAIYPAREQPIVGVTSDLIAAELLALGKAPAWTGAREALAPALASLVRAGDLVVTMGAGDVTRSGPELLAALGADAA